MKQQTRREQIMKRTATILGIAAAIAVVPSVAAAGNSTAQAKPQLKAQVVVQVLKPQPLSPARVTVARVSSQRFSANRISLIRVSAR